MRTSTEKQTKTHAPSLLHRHERQVDEEEEDDEAPAGLGRAGQAEEIDLRLQVKISPQLLAAALKPKPRAPIPELGVPRPVQAHQGLRAGTFNELI